MEKVKKVKEKKPRRPIKSVLLKSIIAYFTSFRIVTIPMSFIYLGLLVLIFVGMQGLFNSITYFAKGAIQAIAEAGGDVSINVKEFFSKIISNGLDNFLNNLSKSYNEFIASIQGASEALLDKLTATATSAVGVFLRALLIGGIVVLVCFIVSSVLTGIAIRKENQVKNSPSRFILRSLLKTVVFASFIVLGIFLGYLALWTIPIVIVIYLFFSSYYLLIQAYMMNFNKKEAFKQVKFKYYAKFLLINTVLYLMAITLGALVFLVIRNLIIALIVVLPFIVYTNKFLDAYAEIFIINQFQQPQEIAQKNIEA